MCSDDSCCSLWLTSHLVSVWSRSLRVCPRRTQGCTAVSPPTASGPPRAAWPNNWKLLTVSFSYNSSLELTCYAPHTKDWAYTLIPCSFRSFEHDCSDSRSCCFSDTRHILLHLRVLLPTPRLLQGWAVWSVLYVRHVITGFTFEKLHRWIHLNQKYK